MAEIRQTLLDRAIGAISPSRALSRMKARGEISMLSGAYKGADMGRDALRGWYIPRGAPDELAAKDLPTLRRNSADLTRNNPLAAGAIATKVQGVVGTGLKLNAAIDRDALGISDEMADAWEDRAEALWEVWSSSKDCHVGRAMTFAEQQEVAFRSVLTNGDHFIQLTTAQYSELPFRLALQHIVAPRVCNPGNRQDTDILSQGVERTATGVRIAYHVLDRHPESTRTRSGGYDYAVSGGKWTRLPAYNASNRPQVLHLYRVLDADQIRGIPDLAPVIEPLKQLDRYTDAELDAAVKNAIWAVLIKSQTGTGLAGLNYDEWVDTRKQYYRDNPVAIKDGTSHMVGLFPDDEFQSFDPNRPNASFQPFVDAAFQQIGNALELPHEVLVKAFRSSYSAARAALLQAGAFFSGRQAWLARNMCKAVHAAFIDEQVAFGRLAAPGYFADAMIRAAYLGAEWIPDAQGQIDENKAITSAAGRVALGISNRKRECMLLTGQDYDKVRRQLDKEERQDAGKVSAQDQSSAASQNQSAEDLDQQDRLELASA